LKILTFILQVTQIAEDWFALNSLALCVYKHLQNKGCLNSVTVHKVSLLIKKIVSLFSVKSTILSLCPDLSP
jgi:hypothetical protein